MARVLALALALALSVVAMPLVCSGQNPNTEPVPDLSAGVPITLPTDVCPLDAKEAPDFNALAGKPPTEDEMKRMVDDMAHRVDQARRHVESAVADPRAAWESFCAQYDLRFMINDVRRFNIFKTNIRRAHAENLKLAANGDVMLAHGITKFSHLSAKEFEATYLDATLSNATFPPLDDDKEPTLTGGRRLLQIPLCNRHRRFPFVNPLGAGQPLPRAWDHRRGDSITPVRNQGGCGSCSSFAVVGALESTYIRRFWTAGWRSNNIDFSEDDFLECNPGNQCNGAWPDAVFDRYLCGGIPLEVDAPYDALDTNRCRNIPRYHPGTRTFAYIQRNSAALTLAVVYSPTVIAVDARTWQGLAAGWVQNCGAPLRAVNHAVLVVGYVDGVPMTNGETWDFWFVKNSWGSAWANEGYIWIRKGCAGSGPYGMFTQPATTPLYPDPDDIRAG